MKNNIFVDLKDVLYDLKMKDRGNISYTRNEKMFLKHLSTSVDYLSKITGNTY